MGRSSRNLIIRPRDRQPPRLEPHQHGPLVLAYIRPLQDSSFRSIAVAILVRVVDLARSAVLVDGRRLRGLGAGLVGRAAGRTLARGRVPVPGAVDLEGDGGAEGQYDLWEIG